MKKLIPLGILALMFFGSLYSLGSKSTGQDYRTAREEVEVSGEVTSRTLNPDDAVRLLETCPPKTDSFARQICIEDWFRRHGGTADVLASLQLVHSLYERRLVSVDECHAFEHGVTKIALETHKGDVAAILARCSETFTCDGGCYHGAMERAISLFGLTDQGFASLRQICLSDDRNFVFQCLHGLGHGFVFTSAYDLLESLSYCDRAVSEESDRIHCYSGVFMEAARPNASGNNPPYFRPDDPLYPCITLPLRYQGSCYADAGQRFRAAGGSIEDGIGVCKRVPLERGRPQCFRQLYGGIARLRESPEGKKQLCKLFGDSAVECIASVGRDLRTLREMKELDAFCSGFGLDEEKICRGDQESE